MNPKLCNYLLFTYSCTCASCIPNKTSAYVQSPDRRNRTW